MTGEQFIEKVREIKEISSVEWDVKGDYLNADEVRVKDVADNGEYNLLLGSPALHDKVETLLQDSWVERVSFILLVNKLMELQGRSERFDVNCDRISRMLSSLLSDAPGSNCIIKWRFLNTKMQEMALKQRLFIYGFAVKKSLKHRKIKGFCYIHPLCLGRKKVKDT